MVTVEDKERQEIEQAPKKTIMLILFLTSMSTMKWTVLIESMLHVKNMTDVTSKIYRICAVQVLIQFSNKNHRLTDKKKSS